MPGVLGQKLLLQGVDPGLVSGAVEDLLGLDVKDLDEKTSQIAHGETVRETANMVSFMADVIGIRDDMFIEEGHKYQKTFTPRAESRIPPGEPGSRPYRSG